MAGRSPGTRGQEVPGRRKIGGARRTDRRVSSIHQPSLTVFLPPREKATGAAVVICPGGGHRYLAIDHEGYDVARWLASQGVAGFVLKYRLANEEGSSYKVDVHALADARRAVRLVRSAGQGMGHRPGARGCDGVFGRGRAGDPGGDEIRAPAGPTPATRSIASTPDPIF